MGLLNQTWELYIRRRGTVGIASWDTNSSMKRNSVPEGGNKLTLGS